MSWRWGNIAAHGLALLDRLEEALRDGDGDQARAVGDRIAETALALRQALEREELELERARGVLERLERSGGARAA